MSSSVSSQFICLTSKIGASMLQVMKAHVVLPKTWPVVSCYHQFSILGLFTGTFHSCTYIMLTYYSPVYNFAWSSLCSCMYLLMLER